MNKLSPLFGLIGFSVVFGLGLMANGCTSPAQADQSHPVIVDVQYRTVTQTLGERTVEHIGTATVITEPATLVLYSQH